ncbi:MAG: bifunctional enoyl-CoA hydratase/phosphate acetyltransferase [Phenylobacterium sp.]|nr:bifunctional enoyl-CoA hydratase/phosphate acetyltransferase [Phenylobacterium sp.]MBP7815868.1 bifunctional enoyl-CoA hydratase/phosphate acetyltransferase [Phenylobacterium sp.]MBP9230647.1 bifunctional enoyl-CoA hydratase/phosphate acetyltransferase [Phenylobacterium sp.]MBP9753594.1 bifunctional enoyl-CoA hydratase/phosphate acetyltransferase [Phenylobacterium sp.]
MRMAEAQPPLRTAVVHPVDALSITGAVEAARRGLIEPILIGPAARVRAAAQAAGLDLGGLELIDVEHSHQAAARACELAAKGEAAAIMKGALHSDELLEAVIAGQSGLRTERRMSHVFVLDVPSYPRPLLVSDAALNVAPDLATKRDIVQNAIDCAHAMDIAEPKVAILSAVETVNPKMISTLDAAALCKMADRGQIVGGKLDGPLAFDNAISLEAAEAKGIKSAVAGRADILIVPDIESGNMLAKQLFYLSNAQSAGIIMGARVPIILTSRADPAASRLASCALAILVSQHKPSKYVR